MAVVAVVVVVAIDWSLGMGPIRAAQSWSAAAGCDSPDYYSSGGGYDSHLLGQRASVTYTARGDAEDKVTIRVARYRPFGDWFLVAIER